MRFSRLLVVLATAAAALLVACDGATDVSPATPAPAGDGLAIGTAQGDEGKSGFGAVVPFGLGAGKADGYLNTPGPALGAGARTPRSGRSRRSGPTRTPPPRRRPAWPGRRTPG
jgi:hypothetical protein